MRPPLTVGLGRHLCWKRYSRRVHQWISQPESKASFPFRRPCGILTWCSFSMPAPTVEQPSLTPVHFKEPEPNPVNSGWYDLVTPPTCQGCLALEDKRNKEWLCSGCRTTFRSKYEANRHIETAGMEVRCRYCDRPVNATTFSLTRHVGTSLCRRRWEEQGFTGERTVDGAFRA